MSRRSEKSKTEDARHVTVTQRMWVDSLKLTVDKEKCIGCEMCKQVCPREAIRHKQEEAIALRLKVISPVPVLEEEKCSMCGLCAVFCPAGAVRLERSNTLEGTVEEIKPVLAVGGVPHFSSGMRLDTARCPEGCEECVPACPRKALAVVEGSVRLDRNRCLSCGHCHAACPVQGAIEVTPLFEGSIAIDIDRCPPGCQRCVDACPTGCFEQLKVKGVEVDTSFCICCGACLVACFYGAIDLTRLRLRSEMDGFSAVWSRALDRLLSENARFLEQSGSSRERLTRLLKDTRL